MGAGLGQSEETRSGRRDAPSAGEISGQRTGTPAPRKREGNDLRAGNRLRLGSSIRMYIGWWRAVPAAALECGYMNIKPNCSVVGEAWTTSALVSPSWHRRRLAAPAAPLLGDFQTTK